MEDKIICPKCHKINDIHKFCVYCGHNLLDDNQIKLMTENPDPYCLNCGRPVKIDQEKCECGYEFRAINCPKCNAKNSYTNKFCTHCGEKLWTSDVYEYKYPKRLFETHIFNEKLPYELRNTSLYKRQRTKTIFECYELYLFSNENLKNLESFKSKIDEYLCEIGSRWKVVSPYYCINCINIIKSDEYSCTKCGLSLFADKKRVGYLQSKNKYVEPKFWDVSLKWSHKFFNDYFYSLAPAIGESQFEYRERLKWEFAENNYHKINLINAIDRKRVDEELERQAEKRRKQKEEYIRQHGGGYCSSSCIHYYEEMYDAGGNTKDIDNYGYFGYYCNLGHSLDEGSFCKDYE